MITRTNCRPAAEHTGAVAGSGAVSALMECVDDVVARGSDRDLVDLMGALEDLKNACCAAQARAAVALREAREGAATTAAGREAAHRSVVSEVALARRESPHRARTLIGLAQALMSELPETMSALNTGRISEWRAMLVARETACLDREDRLAVDCQLAAGLARWSDREVVARARDASYAADPGGVVEHAARAEADRRVTIRPAPACMTVVSALLPVAQGVAVHAALTREADAARSAGDARGRAQIMADTFVMRLTRQTGADAVPVEVQLVITDDALLGEADTPAHVGGFGPVPAGVARAILARPGAEEDTRRWIRRLYVRPADGRLLAMESTRRLFPQGFAATSRRVTATSAAPPGVGRLSRTPTTSSPPSTAALPRPPTARACAATAIKPKRHPDSAPGPDPTAPSP